MASGNATFVYTGEEPDMYVSGATFIRDEPQETHDQGVIAQVRERDDFAEVLADDEKPAKRAKKA